MVSSQYLNGPHLHYDRSLLYCVFGSFPRATWSFIMPQWTPHHYYCINNTRQLSSEQLDPRCNQGIYLKWYWWKLTIFFLYFLLASLFNILFPLLQWSSSSFYYQVARVCVLCYIQSGLPDNHLRMKFT